MTKTTTLMLALCSAITLCMTSPASAQQSEPTQTLETFSETIDVTVTSGTIVYRAGETVIVNIKEGTHPGLHKFTIGSNAKITRNGVPATFNELRKGDRLVQTKITTRRAPVKLTMREVEQIMEEAPAPAAPEPAPQPEPEVMPAELPKTAGVTPWILVLGLSLALSGLALVIRRPVNH